VSDGLHPATVLDLVGKIYEAAAEPQLWPLCLTAFARAVNSEATVIWLHDFADASARMQGADISFACDVGFAPGFIASYAQYYTHLNPWVQRIDALPEGASAHSSAIYPDTQLRRSEYYADWLRPQGLAYALGGPILKRGSVISMFSFLRAERRGAYSEVELRLMHLLMPHLRRACLLHQRLANLRSERSDCIAALQLLPTAVWVLDAAGRLLFSNRAGCDLDAAHDGLWIDRDGAPVAADPSERRALAAVIASSIAAGRGRAASSACAVRVRRARSAEPLHVMVYPLNGRALLTDAAAVMFIVNPAQAATPNTDTLRALFGLTAAEAVLTLALVQGCALDEYAEQHAISVNTVRSHMKRALSKTGMRRQSQLVGLVAKLPSKRADTPS
jgi:DNA-binding CsgD family transcriptional regulator/PAS domain-containing protein